MAVVTVKDIYQAIDGFAPFAIQEDFDNAGFLAGRGEAEVTKILAALDITGPVVEEAARLGCQLIAAHHPVIFTPVRAVTDESVTGRVLLALIEHHIAAVCAHTNLDAAEGGVNDCLAAALELVDITQLHQEGTDTAGRPYGIGRVGTAHRAGLSPAEYAAFVKEKLGSASVRFVDGGRPVSRVAVGGGSCGSMLADAVKCGCDTFVTADVKYSQFLEAKALGVSLMDAGHFPTENVVVPALAERLRAAFPGVEVLISAVHREAFGAV